MDRIKAQVQRGLVLFVARDFITSMHQIMPIILKKHGFNIDTAELERKNREKAYEVMYQQEHNR